MKYFFYVSLLSCYILLSYSLQSAAQTQNIIFDHLTIEQGLLHNYVMCMMQDRKGYLWFGTGNGLDKYDGYRFTHYRFDPLDSGTLAKNQVISLWEDKEGMIWTGTSEMTCIFDPSSEQFTRLERSAENPYAFKYAQSFNEDEQGNIWVAGSFAGELRIVDRKTGKFSAINYATMLRGASDKPIKKGQILHSIFKDKRGTLWIGSPFGLHRLNLSAQGAGKPSQISFTHYRHDPTDPNSLSDYGVAGIYEDNQGVFWVITLSGQLNMLDQKSGKFTRFQTGPDIKLTPVEALATSMREDTECNLWIGASNGLYKIDKARKEVTSYRHDPSNSASISSNFIYSLLIDKAGTIWTATFEGVNKIDPNQKPFRLYRHDPSNPHSLSHNKVAAIYEDKEGLIWVGTVGGGLNIFNKSTGKFTHYRHDAKDKGSLNSDIVSALVEDAEGNLWIGNGQALSRFNREKNTFIHYSLNKLFSGVDGGYSILTLYPDRQNILWLGTTNGVFSFDPHTEKMTYYPCDPASPNGVSDYWTLAIFEDKKGNLWFGHGSQALDKFDRKAGKFTRYQYDINQPQSISSNTVSSIYEDSKGNLWFGTGEGGLCYYDQITEKFTAYTEKHGLAGNSIFSMVEDNDGNLWLGTNNGLSKFSLAKQTFTNYDVDDGLQSQLFSTQFVGGAAFKGKDGTLYFGGVNGFNAFKPALIQPNTYVPPVVITQFKLFDKPVAGRQEASLIELDYDENFFSVEFAALNYTSSHKNQYAYKLEGIDKDWVQAGTRRLASYTNISPGSYTFRVKGSNNDGVWNQTGTTLSIIILPPFWQTLWAYLLYASLFITTLLLARREVIRRERLKANLKIKQVESAKLRELDTMKSHFFTNISHEFRTPLSLIKGLVEKLDKQHPIPPEKADYKQIDRNTNRLLELINQLLDLSKLEAGKLILHPQAGELTNFLTVIAASFASLFESKHINYQYQLPQQPLYLHFDQDKVEKILTNLLSNAFKFTPSGGKVFFSVTVKEKNTTTCQLQFILQDTGIGIPAVQLPHIFDLFHQVDTSATRSYEGTGVGLALVKELVELHGGKITVESIEGRGTTFSLLLPLQLAATRESETVEQVSKITTYQASYLQQEVSHDRSSRSSPKPALHSILIIEDNVELRHFISDQLSVHYKVLQAENGIQGFEQAVETIPELIISDVMMPQMDGITLCSKLKTDEHTSHIPVILLTAKADMDSKLQGLETGADDYLIKPFKMEELQLRIRNLLESRRRLRERFSKQITVNPKEITVTSTDERFLQKALLIMEANMANEDFDVEAFSKAIGMSRSQLHRKLTALSGLPVNEFIKTLRLKRAASLLNQQQGNVSQIAFSVGFNSLSYFTKCFRDFYGQTPTEYVRRHVSTEISGE